MLQTLQQYFETAPKNGFWIKVLIMMLAGISMKLISPPIGWYELHWFNLIPAFLCLRSHHLKENALLMYVFGISLIASNYYWISESIIAFSNLPTIIAWACVLGYAVLYAIPFALLGWGVHWSRQKFGFQWIWLLPGLQVMLEQLWPALFPYYHGALFYRSPITWQFASIFGVTGVTYLIFLSNALGTELIWSKLEKQPIFRKDHLFATLIFIGHLIFGWQRYQSVENTLQEAPTLKAAILQQNVTMQHRLERNPWYAIRDWSKQTLEVARQKPDLVVWPEGALGGPINPNDETPTRILEGKSLKQFFGELASNNDFSLLIGGGTVTFHDELDDEGYPTYTAYNSCYLFDNAGEIAGRYDKMVPLPFGEYIPFSETFPILRKIIKGPGNFRAGDTVTYFKAKSDDLEYTFSTPICYEAILNSQMRKMSNADLFINITNDAWFGDTAAPHQHAMLATVQSMEWGRPMLRLAYTGVSFVVEPHGNILYETKPFEDVTKTGDIRMTSIPTIYRKGGWVFPWIWSIIWSTLLIWALREYHQKRISNHH